LEQNGVCKANEANNLEIFQPANQQDISYTRKLNDFSHVLKDHLSLSASKSNVGIPPVVDVEYVPILPNDIVISQTNEVQCESTRHGSTMDVTRIQEVIDKPTSLQNGKSNSINIVGRKCDQGFEFLFPSAECMSKVVGVGLDWGQVLVTNFGDVKVFPMGQTAWQNVWENVSKPYVLMDIELPSIKEKGHAPCTMTANDSSKRFGIGMCNPDGGVHMYVEDKKQEAIFYPIIWELVQYMALNNNKGSRYESIVKSTSIGGDTKQTDGKTSSEPQKSSHNGREQSSEHGSSSNQHHIAGSKKRSHGGTISQSESPNDNEEEEPGGCNHSQMS
jgi:hypothetical protein